MNKHTISKKKVDALYVKHPNGSIIYKVKKRTGNTIRVYGYPYSLYAEKVIPAYPTLGINDNEDFAGFM